MRLPREGAALRLRELRPPLAPLRRADRRARAEHVGALPEVAIQDAGDKDGAHMNGSGEETARSSRDAAHRRGKLRTKTAAEGALEAPP